MCSKKQKKNNRTSTWNAGLDIPAFVLYGFWFQILSQTQSSVALLLPNILVKDFWILRIARCSFGGFHRTGATPYSWLVDFMKKPKQKWNKMDDDWGYPYFREKKPLKEQHAKCHNMQRANAGMPSILSTFLPSRPDRMGMRAAMSALNFPELSTCLLGWRLYTDSGTLGTILWRTLEGLQSRTSNMLQP